MDGFCEWCHALHPRRRHEGKAPPIYGMDASELETWLAQHPDLDSEDANSFGTGFFTAVDHACSAFGVVMGQPMGR